MLDIFKSNFSEYSQIANGLINLEAVPFKYSELLLEFGGKCFNKGLYTVHNFQDSLKWTTILTASFEQYRDKFLSFGHDWMGRQYCVSRNLGECIFMFDPANHEDYFLDETLFQFHDETLSNFQEDHLGANDFQKALSFLKVSAIEYDQCIGYKIPLFLNGKAEISNYEIYSLEQYWDVESQLFIQASKFPDGTQIRSSSIDSFPLD